MPFFGVPIRNGLPIGLGSVAGFGAPQEFTPAELFIGGTAGTWYDPSDLTTMFTTSAGTTPVAMPGQGSAVSVGLMLDKSQGLVLGSELVTNGDFSSGTTGWSADRGGSLSVVGGALRVTQGAVTDYALGYQTVTLVIGQWYKLTVDFVGGTAAGVQVGVGTSFTSADATFLANATSPRTLTVYFAATATTMYVRGSVNVATDNAYADFDNFSLKALPGNHAIAINNSTARPELRARVNLLTYSEEFDNGAWAKGANTTITPNQAIAPDGTLTADLAVGNGTDGVFNSSGIAVPTNSSNVKAIYLRSVTGTATVLLKDAQQTIGTTTCNLTTTWQRFSLTETQSGGQARLWVDQIPAAGIYIWGADLRPANIGAAVPAYQRIADANTYDTTGFPLYLRFDGIDDGMYTPANLNLTATDKVGVFAGVRKLSDAAAAALTEFSANTSLNTGTFAVYAPSSAAANYLWRSYGTGIADVTATTFSAPITNVLTGVGDISGDISQLRANGSVAGTNTGDQGSGNYGTYPLYISSRNNGSLWFQGHLYSLAVVGSAVSAGNIAAMENWVAGKTGIQI